MDLSVALIASEVTPFSRTGGLADVTSALPKYLRILGANVVVVAPWYGFMDRQGIYADVVGEAVIAFEEEKFPVTFVRSVLPGNTLVPVYFVQQTDLFGNRDTIYGFPDDPKRFAVFSLAVFELFRLLGSAPDVLHCHDWQTGLIPNMLRTTFQRDTFWKNTVSVFTIHNLLYQSANMWYKVPADERDSGRGEPDFTDIATMNFAARGIRYSDIISTVSERYAQEILTKKFGEGLDPLLRRRRDRLFGIIHGIDYAVNNPSVDPNLSIHYDWNSLDKKAENKRQFQKEFGLDQSNAIPVIGMAHRFTEQKGFNLLMDILPTLLQQPVQLIVTGYGDKKYLSFFRQAIKKYPRKIAVHFEFSGYMASRIYAASDMFLMPSRFEPCGMSQLISLRYGSIPIVHNTGGLADTVTDFDPRTAVGNGFVFHEYRGPDLLVALTRAMETYKYPRVWEHLTWQAMRQTFSWELPAEKYLELYQRARSYHAMV
jgi:starch synthase